MNNLYDNGALMLGNIKMVIKEVKREIKEDIDMVFTNKEELLKELEEYVEIDKNMIVCVNYENPMGFTIDYWSKEDIIR